MAFTINIYYTCSNGFAKRKGNLRYEYFCP